MTDGVNIRSYHTLIDAPPAVVFDFVSDLRNLPRWSIHWCRAVRIVDDGAIVTTPSGEAWFGVTGDRASGLLDWWSGPTKDTARRWPTRVTDLPDGRSLYQVTAILDGPLPPNIDQLFADELGKMKQLIEEPAVVAWEAS